MQPVQAVVESFAQIDERLITDYHALCAGGIDGFGSDRYVPAWHDDVIDTGSVHFLLKKAEPFRFSDLIHGRCGGIRRQDVELFSHVSRLSLRSNRILKGTSGGRTRKSMILLFFCLLMME